MIFLWSKKPKIGSKLIQWGTDSDCSHFTLGFNDAPFKGDCVIESVLQKGIVVRPYDEWLKENTIVHLIQVPLPRDEEIMLFVKVETALRRMRGYDDAAIKFWALRVLMKKFLGIPLPKDNAWNHKNRAYCVEILESMRDWLNLYNVRLPTTLSMTAPCDAFGLLRKIRL